MKQTVEKRLRSIPEAAMELGVSRATIYRLNAKGLLNFVRILSGTRVDGEDIQRLIASNKS